MRCICQSSFTELDIKLHRHGTMHNLASNAAALKLFVTGMQQFPLLAVQILKSSEKELAKMPTFLDVTMSV